MPASKNRSSLCASNRKHNDVFLQQPVGDMGIEQCRRCSVELIIGNRIKGFCHSCYGRLVSGDTRWDGHPVAPLPVTGVCSCGRFIRSLVGHNLCFRCDRGQRRRESWRRDREHLPRKQKQSPETYRAKQLAYARKKMLRLRIAVISAYGGVCACCGEDRIWFLTVDHLHGDGRIDRAKRGSGINFYRSLRREGYPQNGYRILCNNCNAVLGSYGFCPHDKVDKEWQTLYDLILQEGV